MSPKLVFGSPITGIAHDSRHVEPGFAFFALKGAKLDGHDHIKEAEQRGASLIVGERAFEEVGHLVTRYHQVPDSREAMAKAADLFYGHPSHSLLVLGITGTSGKTTSSYLLESILHEAGHRVGVMGTISYRFEDHVEPASHTTPESVELQKKLAWMKSLGATAVVMEVSSHALKQHRVAHLAFDGMLFTNLTAEHLDYHSDMEDYFRSKKKLFDETAKHSVTVGKSPRVVIQTDDEYGERLYRELIQYQHPKIKYAQINLATIKPNVSAKGIELTLDGIELESKLIGTFNAANVLGTSKLALELGARFKISPESVIQGVQKLTAVPGRLEAVPNTRGVSCLVDYAHKPDALEKVLKNLQPLTNRLICVFGCGGDRDRKKRPVMGKLSSDLAHFTVVTSDNPRTENPQAIIDEILAGISNRKNVHVEPDRAKAIAFAVRMAKAGDILLIAGKGHEDYQILSDGKGGTIKIDFDDRQVARLAFQIENL